MRANLVVFLVLASTVLGCGKNPENVVKIGATLPLTGDVASYGTSAQRGVELCIDSINSKGGIDGRPVKILFQDDKGKAAEAISIVNSLISVDHVPAIIGSAGSSVSLAIAPLANKNKVVLISPISSSTSLTAEGGEYFFRTCPADDQQSRILADWIWKEGYRKVAIVYTNNDWGKPLAESFTKEFQDLGGAVLVTEGSNEGVKDFRSHLLKIRRAKPDVILSPTYPKEGGVLVKQAKQLAIKIPFFGADNWGAPEFLTIAGSAAEGVRFTLPSSYQGPEAKRFEEAYQKKYNEKPSVFAYYAYDAAAALILAMSGQKDVRGETIRDTLAHTRFQGVSNLVEFDTNGDLKTESFAKMAILKGEVVPYSETK